MIFPNCLAISPEIPIMNKNGLLDFWNDFGQKVVDLLTRFHAYRSVSIIYELNIECIWNQAYSSTPLPPRFEGRV